MLTASQYKALLRYLDRVVPVTEMDPASDLWLRDQKLIEPAAYLVVDSGECFGLPPTAYTISEAGREALLAYRRHVRRTILRGLLWLIGTVVSALLGVLASRFLGGG